MIDLQTYLMASLQLAAAPPELQRVVRDMQRELAYLRALNQPIAQFELDGDALPSMFHRKQAG